MADPERTSPEIKMGSNLQLFPVADIELWLSERPGDKEMSADEYIAYQLVCAYLSRRRSGRGIRKAIVGEDLEVEERNSSE
ncbi:hypothetical protein KA012_02955 [Candidatus Woesebacteria bacterium]|nr:hypothetical protein [Candidatus Woesebacteria bacterium]